MASEEVQSKRLEILYVPTGRILMYASDIGSKMLQWKTFGSELFPTREALEEEIRDIINMSTDPNYSDKDKQCWEDCDEWIDFNELIAPCVEADFEIIEISSDNADSQKN